MSESAIVAIAIGVVCWLVFFEMIRRDLRKKFYRNRVWCVCRVNNWAGLYPRDKYDRYSRQEWRSWRRFRKLNPDTSWAELLDSSYGTLLHLPFEEMVVLAADSEAYHALTENHYLERREFFVPSVITPFAKAYEMMNGKPWDGTLLDL